MFISKVLGRMIEILQEITDWGEDKVSNHIYYVRNKTSLIAYIKKGTKKKITFPKPLSFSKSKRKFKVCGESVK